MTTTVKGNNEHNLIKSLSYYHLFIRDVSQKTNTDVYIQTRMMSATIIFQIVNEISVSVSLVNSPLLSHRIVSWLVIKPLLLCVRVALNIMVAIKFYPQRIHEVLNQINFKMVQSMKTNRNKQVPFYYYVGTGDFSIIWPNVIGFAMIHAILFYMYYELYFNSEGDKLTTHLYSIIWGMLLCPSCFY